MEPSSRWGDHLLTTTQQNTILDLPRWWGQRQGTFSFTVIDGATGEYKGQFYPVRNRTPRLSHDSGRTISRTVSLTFTPSDSIRFNALSDRVFIHMLLPDGTIWPLGKYMATDKTSIILSSGDVASVQLVDEMFMIDQKLSRAFAPAVSSNGEAAPMLISDMIELLLTDFTFDKHIESTTFKSVSSWSIGASRARALKDLCTEGAYLTPWFSNEGELQVIKSFELADRIPTIDLDTNGRVIRDSGSRSNDLLNATNRFIVVSNSGLEQTPVIGQYDVPDSAPYSFINRGFVVPDVYDLPTGSTVQASEMARTIARQTDIFETVELETTIDPRHDGYDVVRWAGDNWLELSWQMDLTESGTMRHTMRKVYQ